MSNEYHFEVCGNPDDGFTSSEIYKDGKYLGRIFELDDGWYVHMEELEMLKDTALIDFIKKAQDDLKHYVNRKGGDLPKDMTAAGMSLWLMQRDDKKGFSIDKS